MQGSMKTVVAILAAVVVAVACFVYAGQAVAAPQRATCSDLSYLNGAIKGTKKAVSALKLAAKNRYGAALPYANQSLWIHKHSATPCDNDYWLQRQYEIHYAVALVRYIEEMRDGDLDQADIYWSSVKFWSNEIRDIQLGK